MSERAVERGTVREIDWKVFDRLCLARGWTGDRQRANELGISYQHLRRLRTGVSRPGWDTIDALILALGIESYHALVRRTDDGPEAA
jgi:transcriptional regulator with XRE-family HTH domain